VVTLGIREDDCPETQEGAAYLNNGFPQGGNNRWNNQQRPPFQGNNLNFNLSFNSNQPSLKD
jgi:hypothetical protein